MVTASELSSGGGSVRTKPGGGSSWAGDVGTVSCIGAAVTGVGGVWVGAAGVSCSGSSSEGAAREPGIRALGGSPEGYGDWGSVREGLDSGDGEGGRGAGCLCGGVGAAWPLSRQLRRQPLPSRSATICSSASHACSASGGRSCGFFSSSHVIQRPIRASRSGLSSVGSTAERHPTDDQLVRH